jgi:hypothetical protein
VVVTGSAAKGRVLELHMVVVAQEVDQEATVEAANLTKRRAREELRIEEPRREVEIFILLVQRRLLESQYQFIDRVKRHLINAI